jgi:hypothetical protein
VPGELAGRIEDLDAHNRQIHRRAGEIVRRAILAARSMSGARRALQPRRITVEQDLALLPGHFVDG